MNMIEKNAYLWFNSKNRRLVHLAIIMFFIHVTYRMVTANLSITTSLILIILTNYLILNCVTFQFLHAFEPDYLSLYNERSFILRVYYLFTGYFVFLLTYVIMKLGISLVNAIILVILFLISTILFSFFSLNKILFEIYGEIKFSQQILMMIGVLMLITVFGLAGIMLKELLLLTIHVTQGVR